MSEREESFEERWRSAGADRAELEALSAHLANVEAEPRQRVRISLRQIAQRGIKAREQRMRFALAFTVAAALAAIWWTRPVREDVVSTEVQVAEGSAAPAQPPKTPAPREVMLEPRELQRPVELVEVPIEKVAPREVYPPKSSVQKAAARSEGRRKVEVTTEPSPPPPLPLSPSPQESNEPAAAPRRVIEEPPPPVRETRPDRRPEIALYRKALDQLRSGQPDDAVDTFRDYLARYPSGTLRDEAELSLIEALAAAGEDEDLRLEAARWLEKNPHHPRAKEVRRLAKKD
jgi:TolA-binding protein